ncbi:RNA polymerase factor sigma-54 [Aquicella lusitana]|uniref:RNA polymerase sigma-54 factor n=1 Tax=Aquicella lusitana TaxID=254246 RepID=A0A370G860_9COXI|nr:RNA polymerase factor sigma-54 [Aquicella lusitana]RDI39968.1 RNA polymerase RpoN-/SigL-like sigma 54 subunit [Aquicella lusitana]VVC74571.1 RNA polymerase sigma-54 factor [Aquicella lusitana]
MSTKLLVTMKLDQRLAMNQQLRQAIALLQYNTIELKQVIQQYIQSNPLIDVDEEQETEPIYKAEEYITHHQSYSTIKSKNYNQLNESNLIENYSRQKNLREYLMEQTLLCRFNETDQVIAESIIDAIDENGYLSMSLEEIRDSLNDTVSTTIDNMEFVLKKIQTFDPSGVGARSIKESLLIQLNEITLRNKSWHLAHKIINDLPENNSLDTIKKLIKKLQIADNDYKETAELIRRLNTHPGSQYDSIHNIYIEPELYVKKISGSWRVFLVDSVLTRIKINKYYQELIKKNKINNSYSSLKSELEEARWLVNGIKKRNDTLLKVASHIIKLQEDFLENGHEYMKSMNIIDVASALGIHESTVSRVTTEKFIATPRGVMELKAFFPSHVNTQEGSTCSTTAVKAFIKEIVDNETKDHALSDDEITELLRQKGIKIARRTVAKYRESMNILSSFQRQMQHNVLEYEDESELIPDFA